MFVAMPTLAAAVVGWERDVCAAVGITTNQLGWLIDGSARAGAELRARLSAVLDVDEVALFEPSPVLYRLVGDHRADVDGEPARRVRSLCR